MQSAVHRAPQKGTVVKRERPGGGDHPFTLPMVMPEMK